MRFSKWSIGLVLLLLPGITRAAPCTAEQVAIGCTDDADTSQEGVQFDPFQNMIGDPADPSLLTYGSIKELTFLVEGKDPLSIAINIVNVALSFLGLISLLVMILAGWKWFMARDNEEEVTEAKAMITGALFGLFVTLSAYGLVQLFFYGTQARTYVVDPSILLWVNVAHAEELPFDPREGDDSSNVALGEPLSTTLLADLGTADPLTILIFIINGILTLLGFLFVVLLIYSGVLWITARGDSEQVTKAKNIIKRAVIGLIITLAAYAISVYAFYIITEFTYGAPLFGYTF